MIEDLRPLVTEVVEVAVSPQALAHGTEGMVFSPLEAPAAAGLMGPLAHQEVAEVLGPVLQAMMGGWVMP